MSPYPDMASGYFMKRSHDESFYSAGASGKYNIFHKEYSGRFEEIQASGKMGKV